MSAADIDPATPEPELGDLPNAGLTPEALRTLVDNHARFLSFLERRVGRRDIAEEILQEAFVRSIDRGASLRAGESATAWFYRLLRNALVDHFRRRGAEQRALDALAGEPEPVEAAPDDELMGTVCACVGSLIETINPAYAEALRRVDLEGASVQAYAGEAGITPNNAGVRLHRAREALRKQLIRSCGTCATHRCLDCHCDTKGPAAAHAEPEG
ncbi:MAG TPA: RNA polymerase sigma factor [Candidatus Nanopelagicales bacterium]|nr:RNA polymerase sigma factor [Candidatus Nanopelagicales bacterium]